MNEIIDMNIKPCRTIPYELWALIDYLYKNALCTPNLWKEQSTEEELQIIRETIDQHKELVNVSYDTLV